MTFTLISPLKKFGFSIFSRFIFTNPPPPSALRPPPSAFPKPPPLTELVTEEDNTEASVWLARFGTPQTKIPRPLVELTFSRSSGPGGQNVNKVNTKVTLRCPVNSPWIPRWAMPILLKDRHYAASSRSILITSTVHRSQAQNIDECLLKLHDLILQAASTSIVKAPSMEQQKKVEGFVKKEKERRKAEKMKRSATKQSRKGRVGLLIPHWATEAVLLFARFFWYWGTTTVNNVSKMLFREGIATI